LQDLAKAVSDALSRGFRDVEVETGVGNGRIMAYLAAHGEVLSQQFHDDRVVIHCRIAPEHLGPIEREVDLIVRPHATSGQTLVPMLDADSRASGAAINGNHVNGHALNGHADADKAALSTEADG